jgi:cytidylate kinase
VYLKVDTYVAAERIMNDPKRNSEQYTDIEEAVTKIRARKASENARFLTKYGADCANLHNFDLVIDTTQRSPTEVNTLILEGVAAKLEGVIFPRFV